MGEHVDAVVIGSGFGGSVAAARLALDGRRVVVLERGRAYPPGSFARTPSTARDLLWDPSAGLTGMFNIWFFKKLGALVSSGLGGGSLIYANVLLRKDAHWFKDDLPRGTYRPWPVTRAELDPHYDEVERRMNVQRYPIERTEYQLAKVMAFRQAVQAMADRDRTISLLTPPLAVTFANPGKPPKPGEDLVEAQRNLHDHDRRTCTLCGECYLGCNVGAKNTLDYTYLTAAKHAGADLRTLCEVRTLKQLGEQRFEVGYVEHDPAAGPRDTRTLPAKTITCNRLILAAGTMGSSFLLMRNLDGFTAIRRDVVGTRFSGNGDLLSFALQCTRPGANGGGRRPWMFEPSRGPTITSSLRADSHLDTGDPKDGPGMYIQDAGFPAELAWLVEGLNTPGWIVRGFRMARRVIAGLLGWNRDPDLAAEIAETIGNGRLSGSSLPLLAMGRDLPEGRFALDDGRLKLTWHGARSAEHFDRATAAARAIAEGMGGTFMLNPQARFLRRAITVHPLGGCPMGAGPSEGVVDGHGQVFGHPGFFILDGSVLPGPVGPNPSLTIAAVADRACTRMLETWPRA